MNKGKLCSHLISLSGLGGHYRPTDQSILTDMVMDRYLLRRLTLFSQVFSLIGIISFCGYNLLFPVVQYGLSHSCPGHASQCYHLDIS